MGEGSVLDEGVSTQMILKEEDDRGFGGAGDDGFEHIAGGLEWFVATRGGGGLEVSGYEDGRWLDAWPPHRDEDCRTCRRSESRGLKRSTNLQRHPPCA